mgnify:CR=1 FL=1
MLPGAAGGAAGCRIGAEVGVKSIKICGHDVYFPPGKTPFSSQKSVISKALIALNKRKHALLESPTGTGKTLALLTSTLSWQKKNYQQALDLYAAQQETQLKQEVKEETEIGTEIEVQTGWVVKQEGVIKKEVSPHPHAPTSFVTGAALIQAHASAAGPVADSATVSTAGNSMKEEASASAGAAAKGESGGAPKRKQIYFCARTHSQLQQVLQA